MRLEHIQQEPHGEECPLAEWSCSSARLSGEYATSVASWRVRSTPDAIIPPYKKMRMNVRVLGVSAFGTTIAVKMRDRA